MDLDRYVSDLQAQLAAVTDHRDEQTRALAEQLGVALDAAVRLTLLGVVSDVAGEVTREIAPGSVDVVLRGREPHLVVSRAVAQPEVPSAPEPVVAAAVGDDTVSSRTTLRLPDRLKAQAEQAAAAEGVSVNTWFVRAIAAALEPGGRPAAAASPPPSPTWQTNRFTGWAR